MLYYPYKDLNCNSCCSLWQLCCMQSYMESSDTEPKAVVSTSSVIKNPFSVNRLWTYVV
jgi:hypothetical protein